MLAALSAIFGNTERERERGAQNEQKTGLYPQFPLRQQTLESLFKDLSITTKNPSVLFKDRLNAVG